ncbi:MAG: serine/threonine-protein phosphatase [Lachnospiraceae bacterium]|nr:serine/threonine-protein phosphatase [Lachnospiraceae bacterium]
MKIRYASVSEQGKRENNQDAVFAAVKGERAIFVVADGMGGHSHGEVASAAIVDAAKEWWYSAAAEEDMEREEAVSACESLLQKVNLELYDNYASQGTMVGSTVVLLLIWDGSYTAISGGDSHIYRLEDNEARTVTPDDIWDNMPEIREYYTSEEIRRDYRHGRLTVAVGSDCELPLNKRAMPLSERESFLLCSDGIYKYCPPDYLSRQLRRRFSGVEKVLQALVRKAEKNGTTDNYSAIYIRISDA